MTAAVKIRILFIALIGITCSVFFAKPWYGAINSLRDAKNTSDFRTAIYLKKKDLLNDLTKFDPLSHEAKGVFRLTVPLIMNVFDLDLVQIYIVQLCLGPLIIIMLAFLFYEVTGNLRTTLLMTMASSCTYFCRSYFVDTYIAFDTFCYFLVVFAIFFRKQPILLFVSVIALFFTDERGVLAISMIWLAIKFMDRKSDKDFSLKELISVNDPSKFLITGLITAIAIRFFLHYHYGLSTPMNNVNLAFLFMTWKGVQSGIWSGLSCFWGFILLAIFMAYSEGKFILGTTILGIFSIILMATLLVADRTRSSAYAFPLAIICLGYLYRSVPGVNKILFLMLCINMLCIQSINPVPVATESFFPYFWEILMNVINSIHHIRHAG